MQFKNLAFVAAALAGAAQAQRPNDTSICDYYTTALLKNNTATNQYTLLTLLVNTVAIGNYTQPNHNAVPGILAQGQSYNGVPVNLLPYFSGALKSTNRNGMPTSVNFLDGGGAAPLMNNSLPAMGSNQYFLVTHLYQYFGLLLGCSTYGEMGFPAYGGAASQYQVHRFMDLDQNEMGFFIQQVGLAATSFGVTADDAKAVGMSLNNAFNYRCSPPTTIVKAQGAQLQSMCTADSCPLDPKATCAAYPNNGAAVAPMSANGTATMGGSSTATGSHASGTPMSPTSTKPATYTGAAGHVAAPVVAAVGAAAAFALAL